MATDRVVTNSEMGALSSVLLKRAMSDDGIVDPSVVAALLLVAEHVTGLSDDMVAVNVARLVRETTMTANTFRRALSRAEAIGLIERERGIEAGRPRGFVRFSAPIMAEVQELLNEEGE